jgi:hypothetical protein
MVNPSRPEGNGRWGYSSDCCVGKYPDAWAVVLDRRSARVNKNETSFHNIER